MRLTGILVFLSVNLINSEDINVINVTVVNDINEGILDVGSPLIIKIWNIGRNDFEEKCEATCIGGQSQKEMTLTCMVLRQSNDLRKQYIDASSTNVDKNFSGTWQCTFKKLRIDNRERWSTQNINFKFDVKDRSATTSVPYTNPGEMDSATSMPNTNPAESFDWMRVGLPLGILALLIIIAQAICIIRIWLKAKARTELANLRANQARADITPDNTVRYTATPTQVKTDKNIPRESGIYEALENLPIPKPAPPPIDTLPRPAKPASPKPSEQTLERSRMPTLPIGRKPLTASKIKKDDHITVSSIDRFKNRGLLPLPTEEQIEYEVMTPTTPGNVKPPVANKVKTLIPPGMPLQVVPNFNAGPSQGPVLPSMIAAAQLKPVNKTNQWNQAQRKPTIETKPYTTPNYTVQTGVNREPSFNRPGPPPVMSKPPRPLPVQSIPSPDEYDVSSDEEEWTYEPLPHYDDYNGSNIYDNIPRM